MLGYYVELNIYDSEGRHEFPTKKCSENATFKEMEEIAIKFAQEWFHSIVVIESASIEFEKTHGYSLNLPKRRIISASVMEDHYDSPSTIWEKKFNHVN